MSTTVGGATGAGADCADTAAAEGVTTVTTEGEALALDLAFGAAESSKAPTPFAKTDPVAARRSDAVAVLVSPVTAAAEVGAAVLASAAALVGAALALLAAPEDPPVTRAAALPPLGTTSPSGPFTVWAGFFFSCSTPPATSPVAILAVAVAGLAVAFAAAAEAMSEGGASAAAALAAGAEGASVLVVLLKVSVALVGMSLPISALGPPAAAGWGPVDSGMGPLGCAGFTCSTPASAALEAADAVGADILGEACFLLFRVRCVCLWCFVLFAVAPAADAVWQSGPVPCWQRL
mmetsp:Transcript_17825/g.38189  ORF Transcript_17825/g.38189 Transcript_17825/m.38189 type:complete len:292 (+) Transcript_17825:2399-3274(+)